MCEKGGKYLIPREKKGQSFGAREDTAAQKNEKAAILGVQKRPGNVKRNGVRGLTIGEGKKKRPGNGGWSRGNWRPGKGSDCETTTLRTTITKFEGGN